MKTIVEEKLVSFKTLEQKIYKYICTYGAELTRIVLEKYDDELAEGRDRRAYRDKGKRGTTIKTVYGEVCYSRRVYEKREEGGEKRYVYLLDEAMQMEKIGLLSANLAEKIAMTAAESPYRVTAETISSTCGQSVSHGGAWNLVQRLGERISKEEAYAVRQMEAGEAAGKEVLPVLFEEMDGVWLSMQGERHQKMKKQEMKVFTMYEGWKAEDGGRSSLVNKTMLAGMEKSGGFHAKREALIEKRYAADEIVQRVLNGDGGGWVKEPYDPEAIVQLDRYHVYQEILRKIGDKKAQKEIRELFDSEKPDEMLDYIKAYADSVAGDEKTDNRRKKALELYRYLHNNREGLIPWQKRGIEIPAPPEGIVYKGMGGAGKPELYSDNVADEAPEDALVGKRREQHGEDTVPEGEPGAGRNDREVYRWVPPHIRDGGCRQDTERCESTKEGREREPLCGQDGRPHASAGCNADSIQKGIHSSFR